MDAVKAGEIYLCDFSTSGVGSMQGGVRPCVIVDNRMACVFSPCIHCVPLTSQDKKHMPLHYKLNGHGLYKESTVLCEQYTLVDKSQLMELIGNITQLDLINISQLCKKNMPFTYD